MNHSQEYILIFANGVLDDVTWVETYLRQARSVIAADGGIRHLLALDSLPDVLIGDLDSLPGDIEALLAGQEVEVVRHPAAKDETDLELALLFAKHRFPDAELLVIGGFGGRIDHSLANIMLLAHPDLIHHPIRFVEKHETARLITGDTTITGQVGDIISLIPLGGPVRVIETTGLRWPLHDEVLEFGPARGISNEMMTDGAIVRVAEGVLLCVQMTVAT